MKVKSILLPVPYDLGYNYKKYLKIIKMSQNEPKKDIIL